MTFNEILTSIKRDNLDARKNKNQEITTITGELIAKLQSLAKSGKDGDLEALTAIKKTKVEHTESKKFIDEADRDSTSECIMITYCDNYLPKMIETEEEILPFIKEVMNEISEKTTMRDMGKVISRVKELTNGAVDGKFLSSIVKKEILNEG